MEGLHDGSAVIDIKYLLPIRVMVMNSNSSFVCTIVPVIFQGVLLYCTSNGKM